VKLINGCPCYLCKRRRRGKALKTSTIALVALVVGSAPWWGLVTFLYVCAAILLIVGSAALGVALDFYRGFRAFEEWTAQQASERRRARIVGRIGR
jgi:hypothetical protein